MKQKAKTKANKAPHRTDKTYAALGTAAHKRAGKATWYCCTRGYDSGDMVAAAGSELRVGNWRGRVVTVTANGRSINVRLVDWCACKGDRVIDLHPTAFSRLAPLSRGVIPIIVRW